MSTSFDFDPFAAETEGWSLEKFYVASEDLRGHSKSVRTGPDNDDVVNMKPFVVAQMSVLQSICPLYRTNRDIMRDATYHILNIRGEQYRSDLPLSWHERQQQFNALVDWENMRNDHKRHERMLQQLEEGLREATPDQRDEAIAKGEHMVSTFSITEPEAIRRAYEVIRRYKP